MLWSNRTAHLGPGGSPYRGPDHSARTFGAFAAQRQRQISVDMARRGLSLPCPRGPPDRMIGRARDSSHRRLDASNNSPRPGDWGAARAVDRGRVSWDGRRSREDTVRPLNSLRATCPDRQLSDGRETARPYLWSGEDRIVKGCESGPSPTTSGLGGVVNDTVDLGGGPGIPAGPQGCDVGPRHGGRR
jgi:hypothetical protein